MKNWQIEKGFFCPMCRHKSLLHILVIEEAITHFCKKCGGCFQITEQEAMTEEQEKELIELGYLEVEE